MSEPLGWRWDEAPRAMRNAMPRIASILVHVPEGCDEAVEWPGALVCATPAPQGGVLLAFADPKDRRINEEGE